MSTKNKKQCPSNNLLTRETSRTADDPWRRLNPNKNIVRPFDLPALTGLSKTTIWRLEKAGEFVKRIRLSKGAVGYRMVEIQAWIDSRQTVVD